jgi:hypothetical protein
MYCNFAVWDEVPRQRGTYGIVGATDFSRIAEEVVALYGYVRKSTASSFRFPRAPLVAAGLPFILNRRKRTS